MKSKFEQNLELLSELQDACIRALDSSSKKENTVEIYDGFFLTRIEMERMLTVVKKLLKAKNEDVLEETIKKEYENIPYIIGMRKQDGTFGKFQYLVEKISIG